MTIKRTFAFLCFYCFLCPLIFGQNQDQLPDTTLLSPRQLEMFNSLETDSVDNELDVPNVFTPNGDGVNDIFEVKSDGNTVYELTVFTRTGTQI